MRYFVDSDGKLQGACVTDDPLNPNGYAIVEIEGDLPAPMERLTYVDGQLVVDPEYDAQVEEAKLEILRIEAENPITHRALREFCLMVASQFPEEAAQVPGLVRVAQIEAEIAELRKLIR